MAPRLKWTTSIIIVLTYVNMTDGMKGLLNKLKTSNESSVSRPCDIYSFERGKFTRLQKPLIPSLSNTAEKSAAVSKEIRCNDAYHMMLYLYLVHPHYYTYPDQVDDLHRKINTDCPDWARKMLVTAFNVAQNDIGMDVAWLFFLHVKRIEVHSANDPHKVFLSAMRTSRYGIYDVVKSTLFENDCKMFNPATKKEREYHSYVSDMKQWKPIKNSAKALEILSSYWPDLLVNSSLVCYQKKASASGPGPGVRPVTENNLTLDLLYMSDVFGNVKATTLLNGFGVFEGGNLLIKYLKDRISIIKSGGTPFQQYVLELVDFHEHVQRALKTMMLRIYYVFLDKLGMINKKHRKEHISKFVRLYYDWCDFLYLSRDDNGFSLSQLDQYWDSDRFFEITILDIQQKVVDKLKENDDLSNIQLYNCTNYQSFENIKIVKSQIMAIAYEYGVPFDAKATEHLPVDHIETTLLCVELLIGYMKTIFNYTNFKAMQSLVKLGTSSNFERFCLYAQECPDVSPEED